MYDDFLATRFIWRFFYSEVINCEPLTYIHTEKN